MRLLMVDNDNLPQRLLAGPYSTKALIPASPWLDNTPPTTPVVRISTDSTTGLSVVVLQPQGTEPVWLWVIRLRVGSDWTIEIFPGSQRTYTLPRFGAGTSADAIAITAVDRTSNESVPVVLRLPAP